MANTRAENNGNEILKELIMKQLKNMPHEKKLQYNDLKRICKYINSSIFDENTCCIWNGYVTNANSFNKGTYINFYFKKKKAALHRLLYCNFIGELADDEYLKFSCENKGRCCNLLHLKKFHYQTKENNKKSDKNRKHLKKNKNNKHINDNLKIICKETASNNDLSRLRISFD